VICDRNIEKYESFIKHSVLPIMEVEKNDFNKSLNELKRYIETKGSNLSALVHHTHSKISSQRRCSFFLFKNS
jgi:hypothetical protein